MNKILLATLLFLFTNTSHAEVRNREKAKFDLISSIEVLVNIDECRKSLEDKNATVLSRECNSLPYLSKYFFDPKKDRTAIKEYLNSEESKVTDEALRLSQAYKINKLGKMTLSQKCVKNRDPLDLDLYLNRIKGLSFDHEEPRNPAEEITKQTK